MNLNFITKLFRNVANENVDSSQLNINRNIKIDKDGSATFIENGKLKASNRNFREAIIDFSSAIELDPTNITAYFERSKSKRELNDIRGADKDREIGSRLLYNLESGLKANDEGNEAYENGDYKNAIKFYNKAIPLIPTITSIYYYRGCSKLYLEDYQGALEDFDKSIELKDSNRDLSYYQRSKLKSHKLGDKKGALEDLNIAIELNPNDGDYYYSRAILVDDYDAIQDLNKAVELEPTNADYYISRGIRKEKFEDLVGCINDLTKYIELNPKDSFLTVSEAYSLRAGIKMIQNKLEDSLLDHNKAVEADRLNEKALIDRGIIKDLLRDFEGAILDFNNAIEINPNSADAFYQRGVVKQNLGMDLEGAIDIIKAKALGFED